MESFFPADAKNREARTTTGQVRLERRPCRLRAVTPDLRVTICSVGPEDLHLELPESRVGDDRRFPSGGERSLYELATAAATLGHHVELRGNISAPILETITTAAGAAPMTGMGPRPPEPGEIVVVPEGVFVPHLASAALPSAACSAVTSWRRGSARTRPGRV